MKAFPVTGENCQSIANEGMDLRDYFAAHAMQGLIASGQSINGMEWNSAYAYQIADAMIRARGNP